MRRSDVVVIGAGPVGTSVACHLAMRGCRSVLVLERAAAFGAGSAGRATGGFRTQFATPVNIALSLLSRAKLLRFESETGVDPGYQQAGYLFLATDPQAMASLHDGLAVQRSMGFTAARAVTVEEAAALNPYVDVSDVVGGSYCPLDGFIRPLELLRGWMTEGARRGVVFELGGGDVRLWRDGEVVSGVQSTHEQIAAGHVVICAGAWSGLLSEPGIDIPVRPERRQIAVTEPCEVLPADMPMTIDCTDGFHLRVRDGRVLLLRPGVSPAEDPYDTRFEPSWLENLERAAHRRVPALRPVSIDRDRCVAGLYEMTPDRHALVGPLPGFPNVLLATGNSGHGVMHAPALGQLVAEMILDGRAHTIDVRALRPERFVAGELNPASGVL